jgi:hypothetical protein
MTIVLSPPAGVMLVNGADVAPFGFVVESWSGDLTPAVAAPPTRPAGDGWGARASGERATLEPRTITVVGTLVATAATLRTAAGALRQLCAGGATGPQANEVTLGLIPVGDVTGRQWRAYLTRGTDIARADPTAIGDVARVTLAFLCLDPRSESTSAFTAALSTTTLHTPLGDAETRPVLDIDGGAWTTTGVLYRRGDGSIPPGLPSTILTITKPTGDAPTGHLVRVDCGAQSVVSIEVATGIVTPRNDWLVAGDFFALNPGDTVAGVAPGVVLSTGTGAIDYRLRWP